MAVTIQNLGANYLPTAVTTAILSGVAGKSVLVKNILLTNTNTTTARTVTISAYIKTSAGSSAVEYALSPVGVTIAPKQQLVLDAEITLQATNSVLDSITGIASGSDVSYVINGMLRDL